MSCERYQQLLHLNRPGEISAVDADDLRQHLAHCESCSLEWRRVQRADKFLEPLRSFSPTPPGPEMLTADIMRRVRDTASTGSQRSIIDRILDIFLVPGVRYSAVAAISVVIMSLVAQSLFLLDDISSLENRMVSASIRRAAAVYTARSETLRRVAESEQAQPIVRNLPLTVNGGYIRAQGGRIDDFLSDGSLRKLPAIIGSSALRVDPKTLEKIIGEIRATLELTFHAG